MTNEKLSYKEFDEIFRSCMEASKVLCTSVDTETGKVHESWSEIEPKMVIRDFDVEMPSLSDPNFNENFDIDDCDTEFDDIDKAWEHYKSLDKVRIMSASGTIWYDNYETEDEEDGY